jgi:hypothetical protein
MYLFSKDDRLMSRFFKDLDGEDDGDEGDANNSLLGDEGLFLVAMENESRGVVAGVVVDNFGDVNRFSDPATADDVVAAVISGLLRGGSDE